MARVTAETEERFLATNSGYGGGCGYGSGYGSGDGYGYGSGDGYGSGSGDGYGSGSGSGDGYGDGYGYGDDGYGDDGYGDDGYGGSNRGVAAFCGDAVRRIDSVPTILRHIHGNVAKADILCGDLTLQPCYVVKGGGFFAHGKTLREAQQALEEKIMQNMPVEERIDKFVAEFELGEKYPAKEFYNWHHTLTGSCKMGRNEFAKDRGIDVEHDTMTPEEFIRLTENAYGGNVIRMLKKRMGFK